MCSPGIATQVEDLVADVISEDGWNLGWEGDIINRVIDKIISVIAECNY